MMGTMTWQEAKTWAKADVDNRDWRDEWKYGDVLKGLGAGASGSIIFDWGPSATPQQKSLLEDTIDGLSKWASKVENILDSAPDATTRSVLKEMARIEGKEKLEKQVEIIG